MNIAREGDFLESTDSLIFDVKGFCHPPDHVICFIRYVPDPNGNRKRRGNIGQKRKINDHKTYIGKGKKKRKWKEKKKGKTKGKRIKKGKGKNRIYRKIYNLNERYKFLKENFPDYVYFDPVFQRELQAVHIDKIHHVYKPQEKLQHLIKGTPNTLEDIAVTLCKQVGNIDSMGVSGSILVGLHTPKSDIDLIVYGEDACMTAYDRLKVLYSRGIISLYT